MAIPALNADGDLPIGRWPATLADIEATFVTGLDPVRQTIWDEWQQLNLALKHAVLTIPAMWVGGSFFTSKAQPGDLDCVYVIEWATVAAAKADQQRAQFVEIVAGNQVGDLLGLQLDTFILEWFPTPGPMRPGYAASYLESRGYWDDLWSRKRSPDPREDAVPRRGYLEVIVDGYA